MRIGSRIRALRIECNLSQEDIEKRTGLLRCYISRVENGHTVPSVPTLEKLAHALGISLPELFNGVTHFSDVPALGQHRYASNEILYGGSNEEVRELSKFRRALTRMTESDRQLLFGLARQMILRAK
jgi:transcriptional regulator with XRE-family HTH domain